MLSSIAAASTAPVQFNVKLHKPFKPIHPPSTIPKKPFAQPNLTLTKTHNSNSSLQFPIHSDKPSDSDWELWEEEQEGEIWEDDDDVGCPWEGAVTYIRDAAVSHLEYCTTLERLGLEKISSEVSKSRASEMGLRVVRPVKDYPDGTPVLVSVDVSRRKEKLRLDGIVRTVITLHCNSCGGPFGQSVYSDFSLLLCEEPIKEPETIDMDIIYGDDKSRATGMSEAEDDGDDALIDLDDQLYFPVDEKTIDISKNIRDLIHIEINICGVCDPSCKGMCLRCGTNLNIRKCSCRKQNMQENGFGPLGDLSKQMQQT